MRNQVQNEAISLRWRDLQRRQVQIIRKIQFSWMIADKEFLVANDNSATVGLRGELSMRYIRVEKSYLAGLQIDPRTMSIAISFSNDQKSLFDRAKDEWL